ncbi:GspH/FimT family pseudopilin [Aliikangiella sp. IMCC44653]
MASYQTRGFTLIDLMIALSIFVVLFGYAVPKLTLFIEKQATISVLLNLKSSLQYARKMAITNTKKVTLCPSNDGRTCTQNWSKGYLIFFDKDEDRLFNNSDVLLKLNQLNDDNLSLRWRAFGKRDSFQWHQTGITNHQNGTFELCHQLHPKLSRALIITKSGRIRHSKDSNGDGFHEGATNKKLKCQPRG